MVYEVKNYQVVTYKKNNIHMRIYPFWPCKQKTGNILYLLNLFCISYIILRHWNCWLCKNL